MFSARSRIATAVAGVVSLGVAGVWAADPTSEQQRQLQDLEGKVSMLESQQAANSKDMAATIDAVLRDAEHRSQLLATSGDMSAGYDSGFFIKSGDAFSLRPAVQFQFRNVTDFREEAKAGGGSDWENGFEVRRMRLDMGGNVINKDLTYFFEWEAVREGGQMTLLEAWGRYMLTDDWGLRAGQFKDPVTHEFVMSTKRQLAVDTSLVDALIGGGVADYTQGVLVVYNGETNNKNPLSAEFGVTDGAGERNTDFTDRTSYSAITGKPGAHAADFGIAGRVEYKVFGDWNSYKDFNAKGTKEDLLVLGVGGDWTQAGDGDLLLGTADAQWKSPSGWSVYGAFLSRFSNAAVLTADNVSPSTKDNMQDYGALAQVAYLVNPNIEVFGRYDVTFLDKEYALTRGGAATGNGQDVFQEITVGASYFLGQNGAAFHRAKFTVDLTWLPEGAPKANTAIDVLDDNGGSAEWILRAQFQLLL
jgi:hypothetical protein